MENLLWAIIWEQAERIDLLESVIMDLLNGIEAAKDMLDAGAFAVDERLGHP